MDIFNASDRAINNYMNHHGVDRDIASREVHKAMLVNAVSSCESLEHLKGLIILTIGELYSPY